MSGDQQKALEHIRETLKDYSAEARDYWLSYSHGGTWQFWVSVALLVIPLIVLVFAMDRKRALQLGFFGYNVHVWFIYIDHIGVMHGKWEYPYKVFPFAPISFVLDASLVPVTFMLVYQWVLHRGKNRYLYFTLLCAAFSFVLKPIMVRLNLFRMYEGMNYLYLFLLYLLLMLLSVWITALFLHAQDRALKARTKSDA
ncbi:CBO0543 family protein [Paenibacillus sp.]|uniref:CBO0543 family protein n=1 Tax=Paenibacillus sp. TaxID=58172 RepID=UPI002D2F77AB|nr:CBO0543 family protein [Paenibacillus sp.]HZG85501.1 CBO0543 family protein [Paenibacillus sp.]